MAVATKQARQVNAGSARLPRFDYLLCGSVVALTLLGLVMVSSASITLADREMGMPLYYAIRQSVYIAIGAALGLSLIHISEPTRLQ